MVKKVRVSKGDGHDGAEIVQDSPEDDDSSGAAGEGAALLQGKGRKLPLHLYEDEVFAMFERSKKTSMRDWKILMMLYYFGLRNTELTSLETASINFKEMTLKVVGSDRESGRKGGKGGKDRLVPIVELNPFYDKDEKTIADYLCIWVQTAKNGRLIEGDSADGGISDRTIRRIVKRYAVECGVHRAEEVHPHTMRHSYATHLVNMGIKPHIIQALLGHSKIDTTMIYAHMSVELLRKEILKALATIKFSRDFPKMVAAIEQESDPLKKILSYQKLLSEGMMVILGSSSE